MNHQLQQVLKTWKTGFLSLALAIFAAVTLAPSAAEAAISVPVKGKHFEGTLNITEFATMTVGSTSQLVALGNLTGTTKIKGKDGLGAVAIGNLTLPVNIANGPTCPILHLVLGPLDLDLLGLEIDLSQIVLDITAVGGAGNLLGNLLCSVAGLLDPAGLANLVTVLNQILALFG